MAASTGLWRGLVGGGGHVVQGLRPARGFQEELCQTTYVAFDIPGCLTVPLASAGLRHGI